MKPCGAGEPVLYHHISFSIELYPFDENKSIDEKDGLKINFYYLHSISKSLIMQELADEMGVNIKITMGIGGHVDLNSDTGFVNQW